MHTRNLLKLSFILSILFAFNFTVSGQHQFGIKASGVLDDLYTLNEFGRVYLGYRKDNSYRHISYLSLPVYYGFTINRLVINAGFQISYSISSSGREKDYAIVEGITYTSDNKVDNINIRRFDYGPKAGIIYNLTDKLAVEGTYYYGLNNIQKGNPILWKLKVQQATLGIRYTLWTKEIAKK